MQDGRIWAIEPNLEALNVLHEGTAVGHLGIEMIEIGDDFLRGRMPVDHRTMQPFGLLHGGAAVLLLETLASAGANHCVDPASQICVGMEISCSHLRGAKQGFVIGTAQAIHIGRRSMVWGLVNKDEQGRLVSTGRLTSSIIDRP